MSVESYDGSWHFAPLADFVAHHLDALIALCSKDALVNVNAASRTSYTGVRHTTLSKRDYLDRVTVMDAPDGKKYGFFSGGQIVTTGADDSDYNAVRAGNISVSLLLADSVAAKNETNMQCIL